MARYPQAEHHVVLRDGREAGRLFIARDAERIHILDVTVLTGERGAGIGGALIRLLQNEAVGAKLPLTIYVETFNPSLRFFANREFLPQKQEGIHLLLQWRP